MLVTIVHDPCSMGDFMVRDFRIRPSEARYLHWYFADFENCLENLKLRCWWPMLMTVFRCWWQKPYVTFLCKNGHRDLKNCHQHRSPTTQGNFQNQRNISFKRSDRSSIIEVNSVQCYLSRLDHSPLIYSVWKNILSNVLTEGNKKIESTAWNRLLWVHTAVTS